MKNLSPYSELTSPRYYACQFSVKLNKFEIFGLNLGKLDNYVQYFGPNNIEGVEGSLVEAEMNW